MIVDLFAGPGGWEEGLLQHARGAQGIEWDESACRTAAAAGHDRHQRDVGSYSAMEMGIFGDVEGLIASPPCQAYSNAGKQKGRADRAIVEACAHDFMAGLDTRIKHGEMCGDDRSLLTVEPLRWALILKPEWIAFEQVPAVLPLWELFAELLGQEGYACDVGMLQAEQYGVPQTRKRAIMVASRTGPVSLPAPTHTKYAKGKPRQADGLLPWVSMADALGWGMTERPYPVIASSRSTGGPDKEKVGGSAARDAIYAERDAGRWRMRTSVSENGYRKAVPRTPDEPAATVTGKHRSAEWVHDRPATTIAGDNRVHPPGHEVNQDDRDRGRGEQYEGRAGKNAIRVTIEEAAVLQSFRADYPWVGTKTKQFQQVGNAIPPLLAGAVLGQVLGAEGATIAVPKPPKPEQLSLL